MAVRIQWIEREEWPEVINDDPAWLMIDQQFVQFIMQQVNRRPQGHMLMVMSVVLNFIFVVLFALSLLIRL